jgi:hypothetical protein
MTCPCTNVGTTRIKDLHYGEDFDHCVTIYIYYCEDCHCMVGVDTGMKAGEER